MSGRGWRSDPRLTWLRAALLAVVLTTLSWQSCVVQSHFHDLTAASAKASTQLAETPAKDKRSPARPDDCPICREIAMAGAYLPVTPFVVDPPVPAPAWYASEASHWAIERQQAHHWRSRAPPSLSTTLI